MRACGHAGHTQWGPTPGLTGRLRMAHHVLMLEPVVIQCLGVASALGAPLPGCARAPARLVAAGALQRLQRGGLAAAWPLNLTPSAALAPAEQLPALLRSLADQVQAILLAGKRPLVVGGDHSIAAGTWRGVGRAFKHAPGLIWMDAHLDAHTPDTSPSGNAHGMPLAALLGLGDDRLAGVPGPVLDPARVVVMGGRSHESPELARLHAEGVQVYLQRDVARLGLPAVWARARAQVSDQGRLPWGVSLDVDALDPGAAPGVSTPVPDGLNAGEVLGALQALLRDPQCVAVELVEFNPDRDPDGRTLRWLLSLFEALGRSATWP